MNGGAQFQPSGHGCVDSTRPERVTTRDGEDDHLGASGPGGLQGQEEPRVARELAHMPVGLEMEAIDDVIGFGPGKTCLPLKPFTDLHLAKPTQETRPGLRRPNRVEDPGMNLHSWDRYATSEQLDQRRFLTRSGRPW
jgi:hypothetical protein